MKRELKQPPERKFVIGEDHLDELEAHRDRLRRGCDRFEQLGVAGDIDVVVKKCRQHPLVPERTRLIDP
jgi:hypothetical protein